MGIIKKKWFAAIWIMAATATCNQSEPPDGSDSAAPEDYYPLIDGATWTYLHSSKDGWEETVTMRQSENDADTYVTTDTPDPLGESSENTLVMVGTSIYRVAKILYLNNEPQFSVVYEPGFLRFDAAWLDKEIAFEDTRQYKRTETDTGESPKDPSDREHTFVVQSKNETITVGGETFRNCIRIKREKEVGLDSEGSIQSDEQEKYFWFAPHVGKIREENLTTGNYEELIDYDIPQ
jgi:hypothetical protein